MHLLNLRVCLGELHELFATGSHPLRHINHQRRVVLWPRCRALHLVAVVLELQCQPWLLRLAIMVEVGRRVLDVVPFVHNVIQRTFPLVHVRRTAVALVEATNAVELARVEHQHQPLVHVVDALVHTAVGLVCLMSAIRQGQVCANGIVGISQGHDVQTNTMIYAALPEFYAILALVAALMI